MRRSVMVNYLLFSLSMCESSSFDVLLFSPQMCVTMVVAFLVSWLPYAVISLISSRVALSSIVTALPTILAKSYPFFNPLIYSFFNSRFRRTLYQMYCCRQLNVVEPMPKSFVRGGYR